MTNFILTVILLFFVSLFLAYRSLKDLHVPKEVTEAIASINKGRKKMWGIILFIGNKVVHYSSSTSGESEEPKPSSLENTSGRGVNEEP